MNHMQTNVIPRLTPADAGCWLDGSAGWRANVRVVQIAESFGFAVSSDDRPILEAFIYGITSIRLHGATIDVNDVILSQGGIVDRAEQWLNENIAPRNHHFGWLDGEFLLMPHEWWQQD